MTTSHRRTRAAVALASIVAVATASVALSRPGPVGARRCRRPRRAGSTTVCTCPSTNVLGRRAGRCVGRGERQPGADVGGLHFAGTVDEADQLASFDSDVGLRGAITLELAAETGGDVGGTLELVDGAADRVRGRTGRRDAVPGRRRALRRPRRGRRPGQRGRPIRRRRRLLLRRCRPCQLHDAAELPATDGPSRRRQRPGVRRHRRGRADDDVHGDDRGDLPGRRPGARRITGRRARRRPARRPLVAARRADRAEVRLVDARPHRRAGTARTRSIDSSRRVAGPSPRRTMPVRWATSRRAGRGRSTSSTTTTPGRSCRSATSSWSPRTTTTRG